MIEITESAKKKIVDLLQEEKNPNLMLRVFVQGGGCSGFQYGFTFDDKQEEDDLNFGFDQVKVLIDSMSITYLSGSSIDFKETDMGSSFTINNPNAETTCGCGSSFSI